MQKMPAETSREMFYDSNFILILKNIQKETCRENQWQFVVTFFYFFKKYLKWNPEKARQITLQLYLFDYYCLRFSWN